MHLLHATFPEAPPQDSLIQLFVIGDSKAKLHIRWADSSIAAITIPVGVKAITISQADGVKVDH